MRARSLLAVVFLSTLLLVGFQLLNQSGKAITLEATIDVKPDTINLNMLDKRSWITVYIGLPEGYNVTDIDKSTIILEGLFSPEPWPSNIENGMLMVKFDASSVINYLWDRFYHYHMGGKKAFIDLTVSGQLMDDPPTQFSGTDSITLMDPIGN